MKKYSIPKLFGNTPKARILDFFIGLRSFDYTKTFVANELGITKVTVFKIWKDLVKKKIIVKTRTIGRAEYHKLNIENPFVKALIDFDYALSCAAADNACKVPIKIKTRK
jgi:hypothetical protein